MNGGGGTVVVNDGVPGGWRSRDGRGRGEERDEEQMEEVEGLREPGALEELRDVLSEGREGGDGHDRADLKDCEGSEAAGGCGRANRRGEG